MSNKDQHYQLINKTNSQNNITTYQHKTGKHLSTGSNSNNTINKCIIIINKQSMIQKVLKQRTRHNLGKKEQNYQLINRTNPRNNIPNVLL